MIIKEIVNRRSIREYKSEAVSDEFILEIIKAGQFAPTAKNNRAIEFIVVKNQEMKDKICAALGQEFVKKASVLIVPVIDPDKTPCPVQDLAAATENMLLQVVASGLGAVWKNVRPEPAVEIKSLLGIPENLFLNVMVPVGYPNEVKPVHAEADFDKSKIRYEKWYNN
ncbi:MAG: nitroreductase family protein [Candidatus Nealsonbacteria bacterium]